MDPFRISETFTSIQGEGKDCGTHAFFIRLFGCNLDCEWCDTKYAWQGIGTPAIVPHSRLLTLIQEYERQYKNNYIIWTGGEPLLQERAIYTIIEGLRGPSRLPFYHHLETNGTIIPEKAHLFNSIAVSPKPGCTFNAERWLTIKNSIIKLVIDDIEQAVDFQERYRFPVMRFYVMAKSHQRNGLFQLAAEKTLVDGCIEHGFNFSPRLQVLYEWKPGR